MGVVVGVVAEAVEAAEILGLLGFLGDDTIDVVFEELLSGPGFLEFGGHVFNLIQQSGACLPAPIDASYKNYRPSMAKIYGEPELPSRFAEKLLGCEIQVELNEVVPKEIVMRILQLYSKGMEYFESIRSYKYMYFQRKMNALLRSPKIISSMGNSVPPEQTSIASSSPQPALTRQKEEQQKMKSITIQQKYQKMYNELVGQTSSLTGDRIKKIVAENQVKLTEVKESIRDQITEQEDRLRLKIERRRFQKATKKCLSAVDLEKSTKDSLFNDSQPDQFPEKIESDFSQVIKEDESSDQQEGGGKTQVKPGSQTLN